MTKLGVSYNVIFMVIFSEPLQLGVCLAGACLPAVATPTSAPAGQGRGMISERSAGRSGRLA